MFCWASVGVCNVVCVMPEGKCQLKVSYNIVLFKRGYRLSFFITETKLMYCFDFCASLDGGGWVGIEHEGVVYIWLL